MGFFEKLGILALVAVVGLCIYIYFHYIHSGNPLPKDDKDWKKFRNDVLEPHFEEDKKWAKKVADEGKNRAYNRDEDLKLFFKKLWNDGIFQWETVVAVFKYIGEIISWNKYRWFYVAILLILLGLVLHYIFGV